MNILIITHLYLPNVGGVEIAVENLSKQFTKNGHKVEIVTSRWPKTLPKTDIINGIKVTRLPFRLPSFNLLLFIKFAIRLIESTVRLFALCKKSQFDIINLHYVRENALYALILSYFRRLPLVTSIHGEDIGTFPLESKLNRWIVKQTLQRSSQIISNSNAFLILTSEMFGSEIQLKSMVVGNGVDLSKINLSKNGFINADTYILGIGRFIHKKGFDILLRAFAFVRHKFPEVKLCLIGDGEERNNLETLSRDLGLEQSVLFYGLIENENIWKYLLNCKFFVLPSRKEPFGIVILEAMAAEKAVVAMDVGGVPELVQHGKTGLLVKNDDPRTLADSIIYLLENPDIAGNLGINGRKLVEAQYTWEIIADKYLKIFRSVL
jgi:glycogen synthase